MSSAISAQALEFLFNHVALPQRLPDKADGKPEVSEKILTTQLLKCACAFRDQCTQESRAQWNSVCHMLRHCDVDHRDRQLDKTSLQNALSKLPAGGLLCLHVVSQNAGLLIHRSATDVVHFEAFEASAPSSDVLASTDALQREFPCRSVAIPLEIFDDPLFQEQLATFLEKASIESIKQLAATSLKAGAFAFESRDTVDPALITQLLMTLLQALGHNTSCVGLRKRVRDDVCWSTGAELPWRRSAFWLVLRVGIQRYLSILMGTDLGHVHYKFFMAFFLARLGDQLSALASFPVESLAFARTKLARRITKLEVEKQNASATVRTNLEEMFADFSTMFLKTLQLMNDKIAAEWSAMRSATEKRIRRLPYRAAPSDLKMTLHNSLSLLRSILSEPLEPQAQFQIRLLSVEREVMTASTLPAGRFHFGTEVDTYLSLADFEQWIALKLPPYMSFTEPTHNLCTQLAEKLAIYMDTASRVYMGNPEQSSIMLLTVMQLWVALDECTLKLLPLLTDYSPGFPHGILDVLQLLDIQDMERLSSIENHLLRRQHDCNPALPSIFDDPAKKCFAERYFDRSYRMQDLQQQILQDGETARQRKEVEWLKLSAEHEALLKQISEKTCLYTTDNYQPLTKTHDDRHCERCYLQRVARRKKIRVHEFPLPSDPVQSKAVIFELQCPQAFVAWRDATWKILNDLAHVKQGPSQSPPVLLFDYSEIKTYVTSKRPVMTLASSTKSFLKSHYSAISFPVKLTKVCLPNGLKLSLFDHNNSLWTAGQSQKPSFVRHCSLPPTASSAFALLHSSADFATDSYGPTANQIVASQTRCPRALTVLEYMSVQDIRSGAHLRWIKLLRELASPNMNFGTESTLLLVSQVALQAGPGRTDDPLRITHWVFRDETFCHLLMKQVDGHLDSIAANWRESHCMEVLITLALRLHSLASDPRVVNDAGNLLRKIRTCTLTWIKLLRPEIYGALDADIAQRRSRDAAYAALLCRRTFTIEVGVSRDLFSPAVLSCFIECSIVLRDNCTEALSVLPVPFRMAMVRDLRLVNRMEEKLRDSINTIPDSVSQAVERVWMEPEGAPAKKFTKWTFCNSPNNRWITARTVPSLGTLQQNVHYNIIEGNLLVNGRPLGKLPEHYTNHATFKQVLGGRIYLTYPSSLPGMTYMLAGHTAGNELHFGFRGKNLVVRARNAGTIMELIPRQAFRGTHAHLVPDLPLPLVDNHVHWLDLNSGVVEIRPQATMWLSKLSDWRLNLQTCEAWRRRSLLVDPCSPSFHGIACVVEPFENRGQMIVYQPHTLGLTVQLPRFEISFAVNRNGLLESRQLHAEIDVKQDIGTFYGLDSKLVLRDVISNDQSVIIPLGNPTIKRRLKHVSITITPENHYCKFSVNHVLNRLDCPQELLFIYLKAFYHAATSFILPDPLTGRTGTEEALHILNSAYSQPWSALTLGPCRLLPRIADLTPRREYYPKGLKVMQMVTWNPELPIVSQHDDFYPIMKRIWDDNKVFHVFQPKCEEPDALPVKGDPHLMKRARFHSQKYKQVVALEEEPSKQSDMIYAGRDAMKKKCRDVFEAAQLLKKWSPHMTVTLDLAGILQGWSCVGGYHQSLEKPLLTSLLNMDFASEWGSLFDLCQKTSGRQDMFKLIFFFSTIAFGTDFDMTLVKTLIAISISNSFKLLLPPPWPQYYQFKAGQIPTLNYLMRLLDRFRIQYPGDERSIGGVSLAAKQRRKLQAAEEEHQAQSIEDTRIVSHHFLCQWPCHNLTLPELSESVLIDIENAMEAIQPEWERLYQNFEFSKHVEKVQEVLNTLNTYHVEQDLSMDIIKPRELSYSQTRSPHQLVPTFRSLLGSPAETCNAKQVPECRFTRDLDEGSNKTLAEELEKARPVKIAGNATNKSFSMNSLNSELQELENILSPFEKSSNTVRNQYGEDLRQSLQMYRLFQNQAKNVQKVVDWEKVPVAISRRQASIQNQVNHLRVALSQDPRCLWLKAGDLWPRITPDVLLRSLRSNAGIAFGIGMFDAIIAYAEGLTSLQLLLRIERAGKTNNESQITDELSNDGHKAWKLHDYPDWLLLEIESNLLLRPDQVAVAMATISPSSGSNSVLQMNMGQGKSSCIIPMVAAVLANGHRLTRIIVPKPLLLQAAQVLQSRLGGLLGRPVKHVAFSRKTSTSIQTIKSFARIHQECSTRSGVMLALQEHILSFKLSGLQQLSNGNLSEADQMIRTQYWMCKRCRDILDESDHTLAVKTQLVYPSGAQAMVDGHPNRWKTIQAVLHVVRSHLWQLQRDFPEGLEVIDRPGVGFPVFYFMRKEAEVALIARVTSSICNGEGSVLPMNDVPPEDVLDVMNFLQNVKFSRKTYDRVVVIFSNKVHVKQDILLLRGLLVHRLLLMALNKRWNVQYGLHPDRDPIAVPYLAKGLPSEQSEWGHPDVAILLTCLSFYLGGLQLDQLQQSIEQLLRCPDPGSEFDRWTQNTTTLPKSLRTWSAINLDDEAQRQDLWKHLSHNMLVIDYFLNNFVFPRHAKQFERKLQASGWDLPLLPFLPAPPSTNEGQESTAILKDMQKRGIVSSAITTGFSGTNDNRTMLPLPIKQQDLPALSHTNAEVLTYLLQPRNRRYICATDGRGKRLSEGGFLKLLSRHNIRMLIDAGALILELSNVDLAKAWLKVDTEPPAAVYFQDDKPWVCHRDGNLQPLYASPYADHLGECLIYLDEAHTRGTDLKMPANSIGALTLGPGQTKDQTVQAAMRLRQLATTQSVAFFAPPEVHQTILDQRGKGPQDSLDSQDVIRWLLEQTCRGIEQLSPLYISQGFDFCRRLQAAMDNHDYLNNLEHRKGYLTVLEQPENSSLEQLYAPKLKPKRRPEAETSNPEIARYVAELQKLRDNFQDTDNAVHASAYQEVEQEKEVAIEVQKVIEIQKPSHAIPLPHMTVHVDVIAFVEQGRLAAGSSAFEQVFIALRRTDLGVQHGINGSATSSKLYVTNDFKATVNIPRGRPGDIYQRPVQWILWSSVSEAALIISPHEAEVLLPVVRDKRPVCTNLIVYSAPVTRSMLLFDELKFHSIPLLPEKWCAPSWLVRDLRIFAGGLFFRYEDYNAFCEYLGMRSLTSAVNTATEPPGNEIKEEQKESFTKDPQGFLRKWLNIRRKGQDFSSTPMGYLCQGKTLSADHPFFRGPVEPEDDLKVEVLTTGGSELLEDEGEVE